MHHMLILLAVVVVVAVVVTVFFLVKHRQNNKLSDLTGGEPAIIRGLKNPRNFSLLFSDIGGSTKCNQNIGHGTPAYVIILRHCDRRFKTENGCKMPGACQGSGAEGATGSCETNDCSATGLMRAWSVGKWVNCFSKSKSLPISGIVGQVFESGVTNMRPTTTASIILESLHYHGLNPCYVMVKKEDTRRIRDFIFKSDFEGKIVVVVTDHGEINNMENAIIGKNTGHWPDDCFDAASVINVRNGTINRYKMHTISDNDPCADCGNAYHHYPDCTYHEYGTTNPGTGW